MPSVVWYSVVLRNVSIGPVDLRVLDLGRIEAIGWDDQKLSALRDVGRALTLVLERRTVGPGLRLPAVAFAGVLRVTLYCAGGTPRVRQARFRSLPRVRLPRPRPPRSGQWISLRRLRPPKAQPRNPSTLSKTTATALPHAPHRSQVFFMAAFRGGRFASGHGSGAGRSRRTTRRTIASPRPNSTSGR